jgi:hypothetical protein
MRARRVCCAAWFVLLQVVGQHRVLLGLLERGWAASVTLMQPLWLCFARKSLPLLQET